MDKTSALPWLIKKIKKRIPGLMLMTLTGVTESLLGVVFALCTRDVINSAVGGGEGLVAATIKLLAVILGLIFCFVSFRLMDARLAAKLEMDWKRDFGERVIKADYDRVSTYHSAQLLTLLNEDVRILNEGILTIIPGITGMSVRIVGVIAVLLSIEPRLTALLAALGLGVILVTGSLRNYIKNLNKAVTKAGGYVSGLFQEIFEKLIAVQAMNADEELGRRTDELMEKKFVLQKKRYLVNVISTGSVNALGYFSGFAALIWCAFRLASGAMNVGTLAAVTQLVSQIQTPFANISGFIPRYASMMAAAERLKELEDICATEPEEDCPEYSEVRKIVFNNVDFGYKRGDRILNKCSFSLGQNSFAVITGNSGIGKSTLLRLLLRIFRPESGEIYLETDCGRVPVSRGTRKSFAYVPQGNLLFSGSVRDNICLTRPEASDEEIMRAVKLSCMEDFLPALPQGLDTMLGENSQGLSEGQAQRLAIARAILNDAPVILLDEATSALDMETEKRVLLNIKSIPGRICIAVTHRPAAVELSDVQLNIENRQLSVKEN